MHQLSNAETQLDGAVAGRSRERQAFDRAIRMLQAASEHGPASREAVEALHYTRSLWSPLVEDLANDGSDRDDELREALLSIGLWTLREAEQIRIGNVQNFTGLIDVMTSVRDGLQ